MRGFALNVDVSQLLSLGRNSCETEYMAQKQRIFFLLLNDWTWWVWFMTASLLVAGRVGCSGCFEAAIGLTVPQLQDNSQPDKGCAGGLCSIEAQVRRADR